VRVRIYQKAASQIRIQIWINYAESKTFSPGNTGSTKKLDFLFPEVALPDPVNPSGIKLHRIQGKKRVIFFGVVRNSVADPGSDFFPSRIPDPSISILDPGFASKKLSILSLTRKNGF
jgi:hypothetical protein